MKDFSKVWHHAGHTVLAFPVPPQACEAALGNTCSTWQAASAKGCCDDPRAYSWEQKTLSLAFGLLHFPFMVKIEKKSAYVNREIKDVAGASSRTKMGTLSAFINPGVFLLNVMFPSNMGFFWEKLFSTYNTLAAIVCIVQNQLSDFSKCHFDLMTLFISGFWKLWLFRAQKGTIHYWVTCSLNARPLWWQW